MPGVLIVEALAQVGAVAVLKKEETAEDLLSLQVSTIAVSKQVRPGDQLRLEVEMTRVRMERKSNRNSRW